MAGIAGEPLGIFYEVTGTAQFDEKMLAINEALLLGSLRQHELAEASELLNAQLQREITERKQVEAELRDSERRYHSLFNSIDEGFCVIEKVEGGIGEPLDFRYLQANPAFETQSGLSGMMGKTIRQMLPEEPEGWCLIYDTVLTTGEPTRFERELVSHGRILELYAFRVEDETHRRVAVIFKDITERKRAESILRASEERFSTLFELGPMAVYSCDASGVIQNFNRRAVELWGREPTLGDTDERYCGSAQLYRPDGSFLPHEQCPMAEVLSGTVSEVRNAEVLIARPDGSQKSCIVNIRPLTNQRGEITGAINCFYDVTERKQAEERQVLLTHELAHRGKNLLTVILSITARSLPGERPLTEERDVLMQRLHALGRSQSLLIEGGFKGALLKEIVDLELQPFSGRIRIVGPDVMLNPRVAQSFALIVHELATNAAKYGALSELAGRIAIEWSIEGTGEDARLKFQWHEFDGPPVVPSTRRGFGRIVLEKAAAQEFGVAPTFTYAPEGLHYEIEASLSAVVRVGSAREGSGKERA